MISQLVSMQSCEFVVDINIFKLIISKNWALILVE